MTAARFTPVCVGTALFLGSLGGCRPRPITAPDDGLTEASATTLASADLPVLPTPASLAVPPLAPGLVACVEPKRLVVEDPSSLPATFESDEEDDEPPSDPEETQHRLDIIDRRGNFQVREAEAGSSRRECEVWSRAPRGQLAKVPGYHCSFSPSGRYLDGYSTGNGAEVLVRWDLTKPLPQQTPLRLSGRVRLSPDDRFAVRLDDATLLRWPNGKVVATKLPETYDLRRFQADHCGDGRIFATWDERTVRVHRSSGAIVARLPLGPAAGVLAFSTDGRYLAVVDPTWGSAPQTRRQQRRPIAAVRLEP